MLLLLLEETAPFHALILKPTFKMGNRGSKHVDVKAASSAKDAGLQNDDSAARRIASIRETFERLDLDESGFLDFGEVQAGLQRLHYPASYVYDVFITVSTILVVMLDHAATAYCMNESASALTPHLSRCCSATRIVTTKLVLMNFISGSKRRIKTWRNFFTALTEITAASSI